ncbi:MAG: hypothetical protein LBT20_08770 [Clostridiales bacterium]|jgi:hypothetical protein|nr:hypothetical protein [Clostridiales bacterium]
MSHDKYGDDEYGVDVEIGGKRVTFNTYEDSSGNQKGVWSVFDDNGDREGHLTNHSEDYQHVHYPDGSEEKREGDEAHGWKP